MEAIVVRVEFDPKSAEVLEELVNQFVSERVSRIASGVPQHTRARLEEQREMGESMQRAIALALANPDLVEIPDPADS